MHIRVELDLAVTSLLGTIVIRRHLGVQLRAHFHLARPWSPDVSHSITCPFYFSKSFVRLICFNTIQPVAHHAKEEDCHLMRPHPPIIDGDNWSGMDWFLVVCAR